MEYFIEAADVINKKNTKIKYYIIGSGGKEKDLKQMVQKKKLENYIKFMGFRADVQNIMSQSDLIVLSSLWEGLPLTPIEAFSVGKTIVATSVDGTVEIVKNKENGAKVTVPSDTKELRTYFAEVLPDFDRERVYPSDIKKLLTWYNILIGAEITDFTPEEEPATEEAEAKEDTNTEAKAE